MTKQGDHLLKTMMETHPRLTVLLITVLASSIPALLHVMGVDFSSPVMPLDVESFTNDNLKTGDVVRSVPGVIHHVLLEWSAVSIAVLIAIASFIHYSIHKDLTVPVMGLAFLSAGLVDAFHTLAATRLIESGSPDERFIPFTWALSRFFLGLVMILTAGMSLWLITRNTSVSLTESAHPKRTLAITAIFFLSIASALSVATVTSENLPQTTFGDAFISRPYDVLPLALFLVAAALYWSWSRKGLTIIRMAFIISLIPQVAAQLHMAFGSSALSDSHFNIAHFMKSAAYLVVLTGILIDTPRKKDLLNFSDEAIHHSLNTLDGYLDSGKASRPLALKLPLFAFVLTFFVAMIVSSVFYLESVRLADKNEVADLARHRSLISPMIDNLYGASYSEVTFLLNTPPVQGIVTATRQENTKSLNAWRKRLTVVFTELLRSDNTYNKISYVGVADGGREIVSVVRKTRNIYAVPDSRLERIGNTRFYFDALNYSSGDVFYSRIELMRNHGKIIMPYTPVMHVATPVFDYETGEIFGMIVLDVNFTVFVQNLYNTPLDNFNIYLANKEGDYLIHPDESKVFGFDLGKRHRMQYDFPELKAAILQDADLADLHTSGHKTNKERQAIYSTLIAGEFGDVRPLRLLLQYKDDTHKNEVRNLRNRSILLAFSLALVALALSVLVARRLTKPLSGMTQTVQIYEATGHIGDLPISSKDETGVLARSFHNLLHTVEDKAQQQQKLEEELKNALQAAEDSAQMKSEFLACMSHEIRTPINGIMGMLGLLSNGELNEKQRHYTTLARSSAESLLTIINDILDFSKVEAGKMLIENLDFDLRTQMGEFAEAMAIRAQSKGLELILDVKEVEHSHVKGDPGRIRQILTNLVGNAIKFTEHGEILIKASVRQTDNDTLLLQCFVKDTGIGIQEDKLASLFDSFTQVDASTTRHYGGTGLGLAIVKQLCELMGGGVSVSSKPGQGSRFEFSVVLERSQQSTEVMPEIQISGKDILVVDDNETNRVVLRDQLALWGANITEAGSGAEAITKLEARRSDPFAIAIIDMQMPEMDGAQLGAVIRKNRAYDKTRMIMMTSMTERGDAQRFADLGFSAYFPKPTTTSDLFKALNVVLDGGNAMTQASPLVTQHHLAELEDVHFRKSTRLLLVEDNSINQEVALAMLSGFGLNADIAANGLEALDALIHAPTDAPYDLVLMDCQMPDMDGYEATREIRSGKHAIADHNIPVIAMTANAMQGDREACLEAGMNDYISKPIDGNTLKTCIIRWLPEDKKYSPDSDNETRHSSPKIPEFQEKQAQEKQSVPATTATESEKRAASQPLNDDVWSITTMQNYLGTDPMLSNKLLDMFIAEYKGWIEELTSALDSGNDKEAWETAHKIKGAASNLGGQTVMKLSQIIEMAGRQDDRETMVKTAPDLLQALADFVSAVEQHRHKLGE